MLIVAVLTLALEIGANTAMFSVIRAVFLKPLPFLNETRLVTLWQSNSESVGRNGQTSRRG